MSARPAPPGRRRLRALFVSDLHLGCRRADIRALNALLAAHEVRQVYLVGDILDGWKLEKRWHWTQDCCDLVDMLMTLRRQRVRITLITGNHDEKLREILPRLLRPLILRRFGIRIEERCWHRTATGARLLVTHGDQFDGLLRRGGSKIADRLWGIVQGSRPLRWRPRLGRRWWLGRDTRRWWLGRAIRREGMADRYAAAALRGAMREGADGIVFGHIHVPMLEDRGGRWLANCGSWTRAADGHHSAIAETPDGRLELLRWPATGPGTPLGGLPAVPACAPPLEVREPDSARLIRHIHALWRPLEPAPALLCTAASPSRRRAEADPAPLPAAPGAASGGAPGVLPA